jgi:hypothetical protein
MIKKYSFEWCFNSAKHYNTKKQWYNNNKTAYMCALKNSWINECCKHMKLDYNKNMKIKWILNRRKTKKNKKDSELQSMLNLLDYKK